MSELIFIDSNIFIEAFKKNGLMEAQEIWKEILNNYLKCDFVINLIVKNEVSFHLYTKENSFPLRKLKVC